MSTVAAEKRAASTSKTQKRQNSANSGSLKSKYLILYNLISALLWLAVLSRVVVLNSLVGFEQVYEGVGKFTQLTQTMAILEILHSAIGLIRAPLLTTLLQVASRLLLVWGVLEPFPELGVSPAYSSMLVAWSVTEVIRYSYFAFNLNGFNPAIITWLRYNTFYVLYPVGICSECWLVYLALSPAEKIHQAFKIFYQGCLLIYTPGSYILYTHMISQRKKAIKGRKSS